MRKKIAQVGNILVFIFIKIVLLLYKYYVNTEKDDTNCDINTGPTTAEAFYNMEIFTLWFGEQSECSHMKIILLKLLFTQY